MARGGTTCECNSGLSSLFVRYCAMHGCNRMLDNSLQLIARMGYVSELIQIVHKASSKWAAVGRQGRLQCNEMKRFWEKKLDNLIPPVYAGVEKRRAVILPSGIEMWTQEELAARLLCACRTYFMYSYDPQPSSAMYERLQRAACDFLAATSSFHGRLPPTTHYLTTHFLHFCHTDGGAYTTVQEGPEHHHKLDMSVAHLTFTTPEGNHMPFTRMEQILRMYELKRILLERGHPFPANTTDE